MEADLNVLRINTQGEVLGFDAASNLTAKFLENRIKFSHTNNYRLNI